MSVLVETILSGATGGLFGGILRLAPEVLKWWHQKRELDHEFRMAQLALEGEKAKATHEIQVLDKGIESVEVAKTLDAYMAALQGQSQQAPQISYAPVGNPWIDGILGFTYGIVNILTAMTYVISQTVRPTVTYAFVGLYLWVKYAIYQGFLATKVEWYQAAQSIWTTDDIALLSGTISFWFVSRVFERK